MPAKVEAVIKIEIQHPKHGSHAQTINLPAFPVDVDAKIGEEIGKHLQSRIDQSMEVLTSPIESPETLERLEYANIEIAKLEKKVEELQAKPKRGPGRPRKSKD